MSNPIPLPALGHPLVVGSVGDAATLSALAPQEVTESCDLMEIRLDSLISQNVRPNAGLWAAFATTPLLFTARRHEEGGCLPWNAEERAEALRQVLPDAACIDIEAACIAEMEPLVSVLRERQIPWIASFHDFAGMPRESDLLQALEQAKQAGATIFKWAATLTDVADLTRLAAFQRHDHGIAVASMGMGPLATVSRLLAAQCGSVLNYGHLGGQATAPGQWHAAELSRAIARLPRL